MKRTIQKLENYIYNVSIFNKTEKQKWTNKLDEVQCLTKNPFTILVYGEIKTGKSSFLNALFNKNISPKDVNEKTGNCIFLKKGNDNNSVVLMENGETIEINDEKMFNYVVQGEGKYRKVDKIIKYVDSNFLNDKIIIDTPGLNSIDRLNVGKSIDQTGKVDFVIFLFRAQQLGKQTEKDALSYLQKIGRKMIAVINKIDLSKNPKKQKNNLHKRFNGIFDAMFCVKSEPINKTIGINTIKNYFNSLDTKMIKKESSIDLIIGIINQMIENIRSELKIIRKANIVDQDILLGIDIPDNLDNIKISASKNREANIKVTDIKILIERMCVNLNRQIDKYIDKKLSTLGSIRALKPGWLDDIDDYISIEENINELKEYLEEFDTNTNEIEKIIEDEMAIVLKKSQETVTDNIKELITEIAKEALLALVPQKYLGKLEEIFRFFHRTDISPIENKKLYLKELINDRINKSLNKEAMNLQLKLTDSILKKKNSEVNINFENTNEYLDELNTTLDNLSKFKTQFHKMKRELL